METESSSPGERFHLLIFSRVALAANVALFSKTPCVRPPSLVYVYAAMDQGPHQVNGGKVDRITGESLPGPSSTWCRAVVVVVLLGKDFAAACLFLFNVSDHFGVL